YAAGGGAIDVNLFYSVTAAAGHSIGAIGQAFNLTALGTGGTIRIHESVSSGAYAGPVVARSTVSFARGATDANDPPGEIFQGDQLVLQPSVNTAWVTKDIFLAAAPDGLVAATIIQQSFQQIPDPGSSIALLGSGLSALALVRWRLGRVRN